MARSFGLRLGLIAAAITICTISAPAFGDRTFSTQATASTFDVFADFVVISAYDYQPAFALSAVAERKVIERDYPAFKAVHMSERASRSAVRPSAVAGWRSGRVRHLAA